MTPRMMADMWGFWKVTRRTGPQPSTFRNRRFTTVIGQNTGVPEQARGTYCLSET
jgi:hypothetical protein